MNETMRTCPFTGCGLDIPDDRFACGVHWHRLNQTQKQTIHAVYGAYVNHEIDIATLRSVQQKILDAVQGRAHAIRK